MGIVFRQSIKNTIVTFIGALLGIVFTFLSVRICTPQEVGVFNYIINLGLAVQVFMLMGMGTLLPIFIQRYAPDDERRKVLITISMITPLATTLVLSVPYFLLKGPIIETYQVQDRSRIAAIFNYIPLLILFWAYMTLFELYLMSQMKIAVASFTKEVLLRIFTIGLLCLFAYNVLMFHQFTIGGMLLYIIPPILMFFVARKTAGFGFSSNWRLFNRAEYKDIIHFAWYHLLLTASIHILGSLDLLLLGVWDKNGMESLAVYRVALLVVSFMSIPYRAMTNAVFPILNREYIANDMPAVKNTFLRSGINILIVSVPMLVLLSCNLPNLERFVDMLTSRSGYESLAPITLILMLGRIIDIATGLNNELTSISQYYKFNFRISLLLLILVILFDRLLIPEYGAFGAAWGATIALIIFNVLKMIFLWKKLGIQPFTNKTVLVLIAGVATAVVGYFLPTLFTNPIADGILRSIIIILVYGIMIIWLRPSEDVTIYLASVKKNKRLF